MIRTIVAIDSKRGMATDHGIPWDLPTDKQYDRDKTLHGNLLMGYGTYQVLDQPMPDRRNIVAVAGDETVRRGFERITDARAFLQNAQEDIWVWGGAGLIATTLDLIDELYITQIEGDFNCTKFFPEYKQEFVLASASEPVTENGTTYRFEVWKRQ
jgi:dihydrofolate reductase